MASEPPPVLPKPTGPDDIAELAKPITEPKAGKPRKAGTMSGNAKAAQSKEPSQRVEGEGLEAQRKGKPVVA
ncbi:MAG: hypothetical protein WA445_00140 [Pseudolabrys sp.]